MGKPVGLAALLLCLPLLCVGAGAGAGVGAVSLGLGTAESGADSSGCRLILHRPGPAEAAEATLPPPPAGYAAGLGFEELVALALSSPARVREYGCRIYVRAAAAGEVGASAGPLQGAALTLDVELRAALAGAGIELRVARGAGGLAAALGVPPPGAEGAGGRALLVVGRYTASKPTRGRNTQKEEKIAMQKRNVAAASRNSRVPTFHEASVAHTRRGAQGASRSYNLNRGSDLAASARLGSKDARKQTKSFGFGAGGHHDHLPGGRHVSTPVSRRGLLQTSQVVNRRARGPVVSGGAVSSSSRGSRLSGTPHARQPPDRRRQSRLAGGGRRRPGGLGGAIRDFAEGSRARAMSKNPAGGGGIFGRRLLVARGPVYGRFSKDRDEEAKARKRRQPRAGSSQELFNHRRGRMRGTFGEGATRGSGRGLLSLERAPLPGGAAPGRELLWDQAKRRAKATAARKEQARLKPAAGKPNPSHKLLAERRKQNSNNKRGDLQAKYEEKAANIVWSTQTPASLLAGSKRSPRALLSEGAAEPLVGTGRALLVARGHWRDKFGPKAPPTPRGPKIPSADLYEARRSRMRQYGDRAKGRALLWKYDIAEIDALRTERVPGEDPEDEVADFHKPVPYTDLNFAAGYKDHYAPEIEEEGEAPAPRRCRGRRCRRRRSVDDLLPEAADVEEEEEAELPEDAEEGEEHDVGDAFDDLDAKPKRKTAMEVYQARYARSYAKPRGYQDRCGTRARARARARSYALPRGHWGAFLDSKFWMFGPSLASPDSAGVRAAAAGSTAAVTPSTTRCTSLIYSRATSRPGTRRADGTLVVRGGCIRTRAGRRGRPSMRTPEGGSTGPPSGGPVTVVWCTAGARTCTG